MTRTQWTLVALLVVQVLLLVLVGPWSGRSNAGAPQALLPVLGELTPAKIRIDEDPETSLVLERIGEAWTLPDADGYPVDGDKLHQLIDNLAGLRVRRPVVSSGRYHDALKVTEDDSERRLRIWQEGSENPEIELFLGTSPNYRVTHVRLGGDDRVYEVQALGVHDLSAQTTAWIDTNMVDVAFDDVVSVSLHNEHGDLELAKGDDGAWELSGAGNEGLDQSAVDSWVRSIANLRISEPAGSVTNESYGLGEPAAMLTLISRAPDLGEEQPVEKMITVLVGAPVASETDESNERYASLEGSTHAVVLGKWDAEKIAEKKLDDLLIKEE